MRRTRPLKLLITLAVGLVVLATGGTWAYVHIVEGGPPARLSLNSGGATTTTTATGAAPTATTAASTPSDTVDGTWKVASGSQAGYRVKEVLFGQSMTAVGRTSTVTGSFTIKATTVTAASFTVDLRTVSSDQSRRDQQFQGRIMNTSTYPNATFNLTKPIDLGTIPLEGTQVVVRATGDLSLHGTTKSVTIDLQVERSGASVRVAGNVPVVFADYGIANPSFGPAQTEDHGQIEFLLVLAK